MHFHIDCTDATGCTAPAVCLDGSDKCGACTSNNDCDDEDHTCVNEQCVGNTNHYLSPHTIKQAKL